MALSSRRYLELLGHHCILHLQYQRYTNVCEILHSHDGTTQSCQVITIYTASTILKVHVNVGEIIMALISQCYPELSGHHYILHLQHKVIKVHVNACEIWHSHHSTT